MKAPKISVLMPVYNAAPHLKQAIDSILDQTYTDFELIIVDDGSTDNSLEIAGAYRDPRVNILQNKENLGISATLNRGIDHCAGQFIARMDADDYSYPLRLQKQIEYMDAHPECALISAATRVVSNDGGFVRQENFPPEFFYYNLTFTCWIYHPTAMYRRNVVYEVGKYSEPYSEDFDLWWKISREHVIHHLNEILLDYRESKSSLSAVLKLAEYEEAQHRQVERNIRYYAGADFSLSFEEVEALRCNFTPLINQQSISSIRNFFRKLQHISLCIASTPNINCNAGDVMQAYRDKRKQAMGYLKEGMRTVNLFFTLLRMGQLKESLAVVNKRGFRYIFRLFLA